MTGRGKRPAVFLDRDGVLTEESGYITSVKSLHVFPYVKQCIDEIHKMGYLAVVVTNQSGVARGLFTENTLQEMNGYLMEQTGVDAIYYCPHHPDGEIMKYRRTCFCRKPGTGMFETACEQFDIDMTRSFMVGDRAGDILAGKRVGMQTVLLESGYGTAGLEFDVVPDYTRRDLRNVIEILHRLL